MNREQSEGPPSDGENKTEDGQEQVGAEKNKYNNKLVMQPNARMIVTPRSMISSLVRYVAIVRGEP